MRIRLVVTEASTAPAGRAVLSLLWLIERLACRRDVHVALHHYRDPWTYPLLGVGRPCTTSVAWTARRACGARQFERVYAEENAR
jgi:hypothetical protein